MGDGRFIYNQPDGEIKPAPGIEIGPIIPDEGEAPVFADLSRMVAEALRPLAEATATLTTLIHSHRSRRACKNLKCEWFEQCSEARSVSLVQSTPEDLPSAAGNTTTFSIQSGIGRMSCGRIDQTALPVIRKVEAAIESRNLTELRLFIDCEGGQHGPTEEVLGAIEKAKSHGVLTASFVKFAMSAGLEVAVACDRVYAAPDSWLGGLGSLMFTCFQRSEQKLFVSSKSPKKIAEPRQPPWIFDGRPLSRAGAEYQADVDKLLDQTVGRISRARNIPARDVWLFADGRRLSAQQAVSLGLVDEIRDIRSGVDRCCL